MPAPQTFQALFLFVEFGEGELGDGDLVSPIDLIPEFLPVIGPLDDVVVVALALRYTARQVDPQVLREAWPGEPRLLDRLIGDRTPPTTAG